MLSMSFLHGNQYSRVRKVHVRRSEISEKYLWVYLKSILYNSNWGYQFNNIYKKKYKSDKTVISEKYVTKLNELILLNV